jgi:hypothetical protein
MSLLCLLSCSLAFFVDGVCSLFVVRYLSLSVGGVRSVDLVQYIDWGSGCCSIQSTLHFTSSIDHHLPSFRELVCGSSSLDINKERKEARRKQKNNELILGT